MVLACDMISNMSSPAAQAAQDQADAMIRDASRRVEAYISTHDHLKLEKSRNTLSEVMMERLSARLTNGETRLCEHFNFKTPQVLLWQAWSPELVFCQRCESYITEPVGDEAFRCDVCDVIHLGDCGGQNALTSPIVIDDTPWGVITLPAIMMV